jgi:hypothetical protein
MSNARFSFVENVLYVDHEEPLTQADCASIWYHLPTTGAAWIEKGYLFVQDRETTDGSSVRIVALVATGVTRCKEVK